MVRHPAPAGAEARRGKRIVLAALGSLGDLHPFIAIALGLKARGHEAVLATGEVYRGKIEALGLGFHAVRPDCSFVSDPDTMRRVMDPRWGSIWVIRRLVLPALRQSYEDTLAAAAGADLLVSHPLTYATRLVAEKTGIAWASTSLTPLILPSAYDPPLLPVVPDLAKCLRPLPSAFWYALRWLLTKATCAWAGPWYRFRAEIDLPPAPGNPLVEGHSPALVLALYSRLLAAPQRDWPAQTVQTGFPFYDRDGVPGLPPPLARFLDAGPPPIVFTLGCSSSMTAGAFYEHSVAAARRLGRRAVLVLGKDPRNQPAALPEGMIACAYAPFSELFPRAAAIVHHGGIGTSGLAMRSGRPMLVVPYAHDQPDNADRLARLGIARVLPCWSFSANRLLRELRPLLGDARYARRAREVGELIRGEDGVGAACDALEGLLRRAAGGVGR